MEANTGFEFKNAKEFAKHVLERMRKITPSKTAKFTIMFSFCFDSEEFVQDYATLLTTLEWDVKVTNDTEAPKPWTMRISRLTTSDKKVLKQFGKYAAMALNEMDGVFEMWGAVCLDDVDGMVQKKSWFSR